MLFFSIPIDDQNSIAYLFEKYKRQLLYYISSIISDPKLQEDALQDAFYIISKNINKLHNLDSAETKNYIYSVVKTSSLKIYNREKITHSNIVSLDDIQIEGIPSEISIDNIILNADLRKTLKCAISELNEEDKNLIILRYGYDMSVK